MGPTQSRPTRHAWRIAWWASFGAGLIGLMVLVKVTLPFFHFGLYLAMASLVAVALVVLTPKGGLQNGALTLAALLSALAALEVITAAYTEVVDIYLDPDRPRFNGDAPRYMREHPELGFEAQDASTKIHARRLRDGQIVYDVTYTIDAQRHRVTDGNKLAPCTILFFGDSFMFGTGVEDNETLPNQLLAQAGIRCRGVNYGFHEYAPHQMLRTLETIPPAEMASDCVPAAFTTLLPDHGRRARGLFYWARFAPRYDLTADGRVLAAGRLHRFSGRLTSWAAFRRELLGVLRGSALFDRLYQYPELVDRDEARYTDALLIGLITRAADIIRERFHVRLTVIGWDDEQRHLRPILAELSDRGVDAIDKDTLLAGPWSPDYLIAGDGHPSAKANRQIAAALARRIGGCQ